MILACSSHLCAQELTTRNKPAASVSEEQNQIALTIPVGTPILVALDNEVRIRKVGQPIHGHVVEPVYAFDKLVIPVGTEANGEITGVQGVSSFRRVLSALDADFTPARKIQITFSQLDLPGEKRISIRTNVTPGSGQVVQFVLSSDNENQKPGVKDVAAQRTKEEKKQARQAWDNAMKQVHQSGKIQRIERYAIAQLPVHPQYIDAGTTYPAELQDPLDFGSEPLTPSLASSIGVTPPNGSIVSARLVTPLTSATAMKGDDVEAVISKPLFDGDKLILPQGSRMKGSVIQVRPARRMNRNGQLRFAFHQLQLPDGVERQVDAVLQGVEAGKIDNLKLDSEGGAQATTPKTRYLQTGISLGMAAIAGRGDPDAKVPNPAGNTSNRVIGGAGGFKLVGMVLGATVHSRVFGSSMGAYGAGISVYTHFIARGRDVVFPKDTAMEIGLASRPTGSPQPSTPAGQLSPKQ